MSAYLVKFTPLEPYFFGNEKSSTYDTDKDRTQKSGNYFTRSEEKPSQSSILGVLRFLFLEHRRNDFKYTKQEKIDNARAVGKSSFDMKEVNEQDFGIIKSLSPIFLYDGKDYFIKMPFDHQQVNKDMIGNEKYTPFSYDSCLIKTTVGEKMIPTDFNAKGGITEDYVNLSTGAVETRIIRSVVKTGIKTGADTDSFFKKEYKYLRKEFSFACIAEIDHKEQVIKKLEKEIVYLGQGKSAFSVSFESMDNKSKLDDAIHAFLDSYHKSVEIGYAVSDCLIDSNIYNNCSFVCVKTKDYRSFITNLNSDNHFKRFERKDVLYTLIEAGSVFVAQNQNEFTEKLENKNCQKIGYNKIIFGGRK